MGQKELRAQRHLIEEVIEAADEATLRYALEGTISDTHSFCRATIEQFARRVERLRQTPRDHGSEYIERHMLLGVAHDTVSHVSILERLLRRIGDPRELPPTEELRIQLREVRNLLAVHRNEHILYRRLTGEHTPHIIEIYGRFGWPLPKLALTRKSLPFFRFHGQPTKRTLPDMQA